MLNKAMSAGSNKTEKPQQPSDSTATPEEQEAYERTVLAGMEILYSDATHEGIVKTLRDGAGQPHEALASVTTMIVQQLDEKSGGQIPEVVIIPATEELLSLVAELAQKSGAFEVNDQVLRQAEIATIDKVAEAYGVSEGDLPELKAIADNMDQTKLQGLLKQYGGSNG